MNTTVVAVKALILHEGKALLLRRSNKDIHGPGMWEWPGGKIEFGEGLETALRREVHEETGLAVEVGHLLYASSFMTNPDRHVIILCYQCRVLSGAVTLSFEHQDYRWAGRTMLEEIIDSAILENLKNNHIFEQIELLN